MVIETGTQRYGNSPAPGAPRPGGPCSSKIDTISAVSRTPTVSLLSDQASELGFTGLRGHDRNCDAARHVVLP